MVLSASDGGNVMQLKLTARRDHLSDATRQYAEEKLSKLDRRLHDLTLVEVTFSREHNPSIADDHTVETIVHTKGPHLVARESAATYEAAIDRLLDKLERQVKRYRDKRTLEVRRRGQLAEQSAPHDASNVLPQDEAPA
jgi:putative sigma-54 modulation protein